MLLESTKYCALVVTSLIAFQATEAKAATCSASINISESAVFTKSQLYVYNGGTCILSESGDGNVIGATIELKTDSGSHYRFRSGNTNTITIRIVKGTGGSQDQITFFGPTFGPIRDRGIWKSEEANTGVVTAISAPNFLQVNLNNDFKSSSAPSQFIKAAGHITLKNDP